MGRTNRPVNTISNNFGSSRPATRGGLPPPSATPIGGRSSSYIDEPREPASFAGRPGSFLSISERIFPWHKLFSLVTLIAIINVIMFIITLIVAKNQYGAAFDSSNSQGGPSSLALRGMGGKWTPYIVDGEVWRLFTPIWLHAGVLHILTNLFFLLRFGWVFEERWGMPAFAAIYIIAGIGGCVTSAFATPENVSVGASGALFGLLGADIAYLFYNHSAMTGWVMELVILLIVIVINVAIGFAGSGVDNMAHLGGLLFGLLAGGCIAPPFVQKPNETMWRGAYAVSLVAVGAVFIALIWVLN